MTSFHLAFSFSSVDTRALRLSSSARSTEERDDAERALLPPLPLLVPAFMAVSAVAATLAGEAPPRDATAAALLPDPAVEDIEAASRTVAVAKRAASKAVLR